MIVYVLSGILTTGFFGDEEVKVLNVDRLNSRIRVLRDLKAQTGLSHTATTVIKDIPRRFTFKTGVTTSYSPKLNTEYYFIQKKQLVLVVLLLLVLLVL